MLKFLNYLGTRASTVNVHIVSLRSIQVFSLQFISSLHRESAAGLGRRIWQCRPHP